jgi:hypothetical protein
VSIQVQEQPTVTDTLDQRLLVSLTDNGRILVSVTEDLNNEFTIREEVNRFYDKFLDDYERTTHFKVLSKQYDTLKTYHSMTFIDRYGNTSTVGICKLVWVNNRVYLFSYLYDESNPGDAFQDAGKFFNSIHFATYGTDQFSKHGLYRTIAIGILILFVVGGAGTVFLIVYVIRKRRASI